MTITFDESDRNLAAGILTEYNVDKPTQEWTDKLMAAIADTIQAQLTNTADAVCANWERLNELPYQLYAP